jgi:hypothetical protein
MAVTDAPPERVWPWLVRMGWDLVLAVWIMQARMLAVLKRNVERAEARAAPVLAATAAKRR